MTRPAWRAAILFLAATSLAFLASYWRVLPPLQAEVTPLPLVPSTEIARSLAGGETHLYSLKLKKGQFVDLVVEQQGIDVVVSLWHPNRALEREVDSPYEAQGLEPLPVLGESAGDYLVSVIAGSRHDPPGKYVLRLLDVRPGDAADRARAAAETMLAEGERLRRQDTAASLEQAVRRVEEALASFRVAGYDARDADVHYTLGRVHALRNDWRQAVAAYEQALPRFRDTGRRLEEALTLNNLGHARNELKQHRRALHLFMQAEALFRELGHSGQAIAKSLIGLAYTGLGELENALRAYRDSLAEFRRQGNKPDTGICLLSIGRLFLRRGQPERTIDACEEARALLEGSFRQRQYALTLTTLADAHYQSGRPGQGLDLLKKALRIQQLRSARRDEAITHNTLALILSENDELDQARHHFREAARINGLLGDEAERGLALANLGRLELESGTREAAERAFREALLAFQGVDAPWGEATALFGLAKLLAREWRFTEALPLIERATQRMDDQRRSTTSADLRRSFLAREQPIWGLHVEILMQLHAANPGAGFDVSAFEVAESARARNLLDDLSVPPVALRSKAPAGILEEEAHHSQAINDTAQERQRLLPLLGSGPRLSGLARTLRAQLAAADQIEAILRREDATFREITSVPTWKLDEIRQQVLDEGTLLLEYFLGDVQSYLWAVTNRSLSSYRLPPRSELEAKAVAFYRALSAGSQPLAQGQLEMLAVELSSVLLEPAAELMAGKRLVVIPDGDLALIPFAALRVPRHEGSNPSAHDDERTGLIDRHQLAQVPSASSLALVRQRAAGREPASGLLAAIGDAVHDGDDPRLGPSRGGGASHQRLPSLHFPRLQHAGTEMEGVLSLARHEPTFAAFGFAANKQTDFQSVAARYRIVHFATHGVFDPEFPELSAIVLSGLDETGEPRDGFLRAHELRRMNLPAELVVVSACETARGTKVRGEGLVGLGSSLLSAGAERVLVSLWEVDDQATAALIHEFYRALLIERLDAAGALRRAQLAIARQTRWRAPYFWAGFILIGDGHLLPQV